MTTGRAFAISARAGEWTCGEVSLSALAEQFGTPLYVYAGDQVLERARLFQRAFSGQPHTVCYAVKANSSLALLRLLASEGCGFDIVSGGELLRVQRAAGRDAAEVARRVVFSGVGKTAPEMDAALLAEICMFNVESEGELRLLAERAAALGRPARFALRVNPDVFAETHPYISTGLSAHKFGIAIERAREVYRKSLEWPSLRAVGVSVHIGSQIRQVRPFAAALERVVDLIRTLRSDGHAIEYADAGGGLGIDYGSAEADGLELEVEGLESAASAQMAEDLHLEADGPVSGAKGLDSGAEGFDAAEQVGAYAAALRSALGDMGVHLLLEPGRFLVGQAGALLTRVLYTKSNGEKRFVVTDAGMNDLIRPSLYGAHHEIVPVRPRPSETMRMVDVVGPVCESGDFFARDRRMPHVEPGDLLAVLDAGAYGMSLSSNYNTRVRPAEVVVEAGKARLVRRRESYEDLLQPEIV